MLSGDWALMILDVIGGGALAATVASRCGAAPLDESNLEGCEPVLLDPPRRGRDHCR
jgi:hypothetical protein